MEKVLSIIGCLVLLVSTGDAIQTFARCKLRYNKNAAAATLTNSQKLTGTIWFEEKDGKTTISGTVNGFTGGNGIKHGFHIHEKANRMNDCNANGGHFNPKGVDHGAPDAAVRHYGDLGNLEVQSQKAVVKAENQNAYVTLTGDDTVIGRSIVIHAGEDDLGLGGHADSKTTGNAGGRLACCVIEEYQAIKYTASCELMANTNAAAPGSGGYSGTINLVQDLSQAEPADRMTQIQGIITGFNATDSVNGTHGFHVHELGNDNNDCNANKGHYNPEDQENFHGGPNAAKRHYGDLGNIEERQGNASIDITDDYVELFGEYSVVGRSFVLHEGTDDLGLGNESDSLTTGHAGGRLACCKITQNISAANQKASSLTLMATLLFVVVLLRIVS